MPTIAVIGKLKVQMFFGDHNPPHVHVYGGGAAAIVRIEDGSFLAGTLPGTTRRKVVDWIADHRAELMARWREYRGE